MIDWNKIETDTEPKLFEKQFLKIGIELKKQYPKMIISSEQNDYVIFATEIVEECSKQSSHELNTTYEKGELPRKDDSEFIGQSFMNKFLKKFHKSICAELHESKRISSNSKDIIIILVPTIITLLNLPFPYATIAVPISVLTTKIGLETLCDDYAVTKSKKEIVEERLNIHTKNLLYLEKEKLRYKFDTVPKALNRSIKQEEKVVRELEKTLREL